MTRPASGQNSFIAQQEEDYYRAIDKLSTFPTTGEITTHVNQLLHEVTRLKNLYPNMTPELTVALTSTYELLTRTLLPTAYEDIAKTMYGHSSPGMHILGGIMLALCAVSIAFAAITMPVSVALTTTFSIASAFCFFNGRRHGLSETMHHLANDMTKKSNAEKKDSPEFSV